MSKSSLITAAERFLKLGPRSARALAQFLHLQKASGKAFAAEVPRNVMIILLGGISDPNHSSSPPNSRLSPRSPSHRLPFDLHAASECAQRGFPVVTG